MKLHDRLLNILENKPKCSGNCGHNEFTSDGDIN